MEREHRDGKTWCYLHPEELVIGVCAMCLHQRLLILAKKQQQQQRRQHDNHNYSSSSSSCISLHKVFAFGSLLHRLHIVRRRKSSDDTTTASISQQESFISINLEDNSIKSSSWEKKAIVPKVLVPSSDHQNDSQRSITKSCLAEHTKPRSSNLRWPNQIGHWFQLIAWKKRQ
ncbi:hypothetical protein LIER_06111 [Lithospermum erythrorhizon]|uniref:Uncharacterized protein n=1 Tax=Lithospermum erythrorhizon TaxID=34254 RepID=A0AAV3P3M8_LITER